MKNKTNIIFIIFILSIFSISLVSANNIFFEETFTNNEFNLSQCDYISGSFSCNYFDGIVVNSIDLCQNFTKTDYLNSNSINLDNRWNCLYSSHGVGIINSVSGGYNESQNVNTPEGLIFSYDRNVECQSPSNCRMGISYISDTYFDFNVNSIGSFYCRDFVTYQTMFYLGDDSGEHGFSFALNRDATECGTVGSSPNCCEGFLKNLSYDCTTGSMVLVNFTGQDIIDYCPLLNTSELRTLSRIELRTIFTNDLTSGVIDDLSFTLSNGTNSLPILNNISWDEKTKCKFNESDDVTFNYNLSITDEDNDQLYYATQWTTSDDTGINFEFSRNTFIFGTVIDYSIVNYEKDYNNYCSITTSEFNSSINDYFNIEYNTDFDDYVLNLDNCTSNDNKILFDLSKEYEFFDFQTNFIMSNNSVLNITFYDSGIQNKILKILINKNDSGYFVSYLNDSVISPLFNQTTSVEDINLFRIKTNSQEKDFQILYWFGEQTSLISKSDIDKIRYIEFETNEQEVFIDYIDYSGFAITPIWSDVEPNSLTVSDTGTYYLRLYYTDIVNKDLGKYQTFTDFVNVRNEYCINDYKLLEEYPNTPFSWFNELIYGLRQFSVMFDNMGMLETVEFAFFVGLILIAWYFYDHHSKNTDRETQEIIQVIFFRLFIITTILFMMFLIDLEVFLFFSIGGILVFSKNIIDNLVNNEHELHIVYMLALNTIFSYIWFGLFQYAFNFNFGIPEFPTLSFSITFLKNLISYLFNLMFFKIPDVSIFLNMVMSFIRFIGIIALVDFILRRISPTY